MHYIASLAVAMMLLGGCAADGNFRLPSMPGSESAPDATAAADTQFDETPRGQPPRRATPGQHKLAEGLELYEKGDFAGAIQVLSAPELAKADHSTRIEANKYLAFSYCVTQRRTLCRRTFDAMLRLDRSYELKPNESGHPLWGPVFVQARKAAAQRAN